jgi:hypothetical protein
VLALFKSAQHVNLERIEWSVIYAHELQRNVFNELLFIDIEQSLDLQ